MADGTDMKQITLRDQGFAKRYELPLSYHRFRCPPSRLSVDTLVCLGTTLSWIQNGTERCLTVKNAWSLITLVPRSLSQGERQTFFAAGVNRKEILFHGPYHLQRAILHRLIKYKMFDWCLERRWLLVTVRISIGRQLSDMLYYVDALQCEPEMVLVSTHEI